MKNIKDKAYSALERAILSDDKDIELKGDDAFLRFMQGNMSVTEMEKWAEREEEYRIFHPQPK